MADRPVADIPYEELTAEIEREEAILHDHRLRALHVSTDIERLEAQLRIERYAGLGDRIAFREQRIRDLRDAIAQRRPLLAEQRARIAAYEDQIRDTLDAIEGFRSAISAYTDLIDENRQRIPRITALIPRLGFFEAYYYRTQLIPLLWGQVGRWTRDRNARHRDLRFQQRRQGGLTAAVNAHQRQLTQLLADQRRDIGALASNTRWNLEEAALLDRIRAIQADIDDLARQYVDIRAAIQYEDDRLEQKRERLKVPPVQLYRIKIRLYNEEYSRDTPVGMFQGFFDVTSTLDPATNLPIWDWWYLQQQIDIAKRDMIRYFKGMSRWRTPDEMGLDYYFATDRRGIPSPTQRITIQDSVAQAQQAREARLRPVRDIQAQMQGLIQHIDALTRQIQRHDEALREATPVQRMQIERERSAAIARRTDLQADLEIAQYQLRQTRAALPPPVTVTYGTVDARLRRMADRLTLDDLILGLSDEAPVAVDAPEPIARQRFLIIDPATLVLKWSETFPSPQPTHEQPTAEDTQRAIDELQGGMP